MLLLTLDCWELVVFLIGCTAWFPSPFKDILLGFKFIVLIFWESFEILADVDCYETLVCDEILLVLDVVDDCEWADEGGFY